MYSEVLANRWNCAMYRNPSYQTWAKPGAALQAPMSLIDPFPPTALRRRQVQKV